MNHEDIIEEAQRVIELLRNTLRKRNTYKGSVIKKCCLNYCKLQIYSSRNNLNDKTYWNHVLELIKRKTI